MTIRTHNCGELNNNHIDKTVQLSGWVNSIRTHGQIIFIDIRDRFGKTQVILSSDELIEIGKTLSNEDVIHVSGKVSAREKDLINPDLSTGEIEVLVEKIDLLSTAEPMPLSIQDREASSEEHRLKYRYLELRNSSLQNNLIIRHKTAQVVRNFLSENNFLDSEGYGIPKFYDIKTYKSFDKNSPWRKRRSHIIKQQENFNNKLIRLYLFEQCHSRGMKEYGIYLKTIYSY